MFHEGSGLGNQLFRYVATRVLATDKGCDWGMMCPWLFKGASFMQIDLGLTPPTDTNLARFVGYKSFVEKRVDNEQGVDIRGYDPEVNFVEDNTIIDGEFQDSRYFMHRIDEVREWLKVEPLDIPNDLCVVGFRGGEYKVFPDLYLTKEYWDEAITKMRAINPAMRFEVHTDDPEEAKKFFPDFPCIQDIGLNWRSVRYAKYLIIANSSFYILPALLNQDLKVKPIAPRYWARRNTKTWALPQNYYPEFNYI